MRAPVGALRPEYGVDLRTGVRVVFVGEEVVGGRLLAVDTQ
jgi:hypothetical protein